LTDAAARPMSDGELPGEAQHRSMFTNPVHHRRATADERRFLDALVFWRGLYAARGPRDSEPVESLASVIGEAERRMTALRLGAFGPA
jgi:hypothetical protein